MAKKSIIMDNKLIKQYGEDILSYRLRSARHKKRAQREAFDKQLIALHYEQKALWALGLKHWILHRSPDPSMKKRLEEIRKYIRWNNYDGRQQKLVYGRAFVWDDRPEHRVDYPYKHWPVRKIIDETIDEVFNE